MQKKYLIFILLTISMLTNIFLYYDELSFPFYWRSSEKIRKTRRVYKGLIVNTTGCKIPNMDVFDKEIQPFIIKNGLFDDCSFKLPELIGSNLTSIYVNHSALAAYNVTNLNNLYCYYNSFQRRVPRPNEKDQQLLFSNRSIQLNDSVNIYDEFIIVKCNYSQKTIYKNILAFVPRNKISNKENGLKEPLLNVLILGLDGVSRLNLHRQMPHTVEILKKMYAIEYYGYNKVGDNTYENLIPLLTGLRPMELECLFHKNSRFDKCHFIWNEYKDRGYITAYGETSAFLGLFHHYRNGFTKQPTDYFYSYFNRYQESVLGNWPALNVQRCVQSRPIYKELLSYVEKFVFTMHEKRLPYFAFFWETSLSHDYFNQPTTGDEHYANFFKELQEKGYLNNTILFFISDHGIRYGKVRQTFQGSLEERLPFVFTVLPKRFRVKFKKRYKHFEENARKLTTPFDLHQTLLEIVYLSESKRGKSSKVVNSRAISFFREINESRTCADAEISQKWCTCQKEIILEMSVEDPFVLQGAKHAVAHINTKLNSLSECAQLELRSVISAQLEIEDKLDNKVSYYVLQIITTPGMGIFEVTLLYDLNIKRFSVIDPISRLTFYKEQSKCIDNVNLKLYCYCAE